MTGSPMYVGATRSSQIGVLLTEIARAADAIPYNLSALSMRLPLGLPQAATDIHWLRLQREQLGEERFWRVVRGQLEEESADNLRQLLDQLESEQRASAWARLLRWLAILSWTTTSMACAGARGDSQRPRGGVEGGLRAQAAVGLPRAIV